MPPPPAHSRVHDPAHPCQQPRSHPPVRQLIVVVFPAPFGPSRQNSWPCSMPSQVPRMAQKSVRGALGGWPRTQALREAPAAAMDTEGALNTLRKPYSSAAYAAGAPAAVGLLPSGTTLPPAALRYTHKYTKRKYVCCVQLCQCCSQTRQCHSAGRTCLHTRRRKASSAACKEVCHTAAMR